MTRLQTFAERLTREMTRASFSDFQAGGTANSATSAARLVAERMVREFAQDAMWAAQGPQRKGWRAAFAYLDEPEKP